MADVPVEISQKEVTIEPPIQNTTAEKNSDVQENPTVSVVTVAVEIDSTTVPDVSKTGDDDEKSKVGSDYESIESIMHFIMNPDDVAPDNTQNPCIPEEKVIDTAVLKIPAAEEMDIIPKETMDTEITSPANANEKNIVEKVINAEITSSEIAVNAEKNTTNSDDVVVEKETTSEAVKEKNDDSESGFGDASNSANILDPVTRESQNITDADDTSMDGIHDSELDGLLVEGSARYRGDSDQYDDEDNSDDHSAEGVEGLSYRGGLGDDSNQEYGDRASDIDDEDFVPTQDEEEDDDDDEEDDDDDEDDLGTGRRRYNKKTVRRPSYQGQRPPVKTDEDFADDENDDAISNLSVDNANETFGNIQMQVVPVTFDTEDTIGGISSPTVEHDESSTAMEDVLMDVDSRQNSECSFDIQIVSVDGNIRVEAEVEPSVKTDEAIKLDICLEREEIESLASTEVVTLQTPIREAIKNIEESQVIAELDKDMELLNKRIADDVCSSACDTLLQEKATIENEESRLKFPEIPLINPETLNTDVSMGEEKTPDKTNITVGKKLQTNSSLIEPDRVVSTAEMPENVDASLPVKMYESREVTDVEKEKVPECMEVDSGDKEVQDSESHSSSLKIISDINKATKAFEDCLLSSKTSILATADVKKHLDMEMVVDETPEKNPEKASTSKDQLSPKSKIGDNKDNILAKTSRLSIAKEATKVTEDIVCLEESSSDSDAVTKGKEADKEIVKTEEENKSEPTKEILSNLITAAKSTPATDLAVSKTTAPVPAKVTEIFLLDSDDDDVIIPKVKKPEKKTHPRSTPVAKKLTAPRRSSSKKHSSTKSIIKDGEKSGSPMTPASVSGDNAEKSLMELCANPRCQSDPKGSIKLEQSPSVALSLHRATQSGKLCVACLQEAVGCAERLVCGLREGASLYKIALPNTEDLVEISSSDSETTEDQPKFLKQAAKRKRRTKSPKVDGDNQYSLTDDEMLLITCNIEKVMEEVCSKFSISKHIATYEESIRQDLLLLQKDAMEFELELSELQKKTDYTRNHFYDTFKPPTSSFPELLINSLIDERTGQDFHKQTIELADDEWTPDRLGYSAKKKLTTAPEVQDVAERRSTRVRKPVNYNVDTEEALQQAALVAGLRIPNAAECEAALPPEGPEERVLVPLKVGDVMYAVRHSIFSAWVLATIMEIWAKGTMLSNGTLALFTLMTVKFEAATRGEGFVIKQVTGRQVACLKPSAFRYTIGTRVIALFKDQTHQKKKDAYYSGVIAETPSPSNIFRYLVFFDDGYAQYVKHTDAIRVCEMSLRVYEDVHADSRDFIKKYLSTYPDRAMVRMQPGQEVKVEWSGKWWVSRVLAVDSSLALMRFEEGENTVVREEWIYRGSTRLLPLFLELQAADRRAQGRHRAPGATSNTNKMANYPYVEYTRLDEVTTAPPMATEDVSPIIPVAVPLPLPTPVSAPVTIPVAVPMVLPAPPPTSQGVQPTEPRAVAKKSTTHRKKDSKVEQPVTPALPQPQIPRRATPAGAMEPHSDQVRSKVVYYTPKVKVKPKKLAPHACSPNCLNKDALPLRILKTHNPLARPLLSGWERLIMKSRGKRTIMYRAPCGRRLRSPQELHLYLRLTASEMSVDLFDFDHWVHCLAEYVLTKCFVTKRDISHGVEAVPIQCVNDCDHTLPQFCAYSTRRIPTQGVDLNLDQEFLCGCDCTDDCQNKETCQCWQLTYEGARVVGYDPNRVGYQYKRLLEPVPTGIYECNSRCKCAMTCLNRVVQHPLQLKLQVFKTVNRGWGIKALNDIPRGCFLCIYAGNLLTDAVANVDGVNEGDEFLAELDYIEVVEKLKESYESDVPDEDKILDKKHESNTSDEDDDDDDDEENETENKRAKRDGPAGESDEEFTPSCFVPLDEAGTRRSTRQKKKKNKSKDKKMDIPVTVAEINKVIGIAEPMETDEPVKEMSQSETDRCIEELKEKIGVLNVANKEDSVIDKTVDNKTDNVENDQVKDDIKLPDSTIESKEKTTGEKVKDKIFDVDAEDEKKQKEVDEKTEKDKPIKKPGDDDMITISDDEEAMREPSRFTAPEGLNEDEYVPKYRSVRSLFGPDEACFIMDAKVQGNLGRYLNHSCTPNVFVQNVFVDTHDPRFPWVAFFALNHVRAGTELTWNYNYDVGSVPGKVLYCYCGAVTCRGRLL